MKGSWKHEFDVRYRQATSGGDIRMIDNANLILTKALEGLEDMLRCEKTRGTWNTRTNKCSKNILGKWSSNEGKYIKSF